MRAELYRGLSLLLILVMLLSIQPPAYGEEVLLEEPAELQGPVPTEEAAEEEILPEAEQATAWDEEHEIWIENTEAFESAEENTGADIRFLGCGLVLSDRIGLAFYLDVPEAYRVGSFMNFSGQGVERSCAIPDAPDGHGRYRFVCWLSPLELARSIMPTFVWGDLSVAGDASSVREIIEAAEEESRRRDLLYALGNYGHFAELCFGRTEAEMPQYGEEGYDYDAIYAALSDQKMQWKGAGGIAQPVPLIRVDPAFRLVLSFGTLEDAGEKPAVTVYDAVIEPDENELFPLAAVYVNSFGTMLDADIEQGGAHAALKLSALSLVRETLDPRGSCTPEQRDFCAALYTLYEAVRTWEAAG
ncbi:MAG: hypothetical protein IJQ36_08090 [Oscillospiraceae bacterium]|nr:hypothetical protein [Oscillospiraceae bacterium]